MHMAQKEGANKRRPKQQPQRLVSAVVPMANENGPNETRSSHSLQLHGSNWSPKRIRFTNRKQAQSIGKVLDPSAKLRRVLGQNHAQTRRHYCGRRSAQTKSTLSLLPSAILATSNRTSLLGSISTQQTTSTSARMLRTNPIAMSTNELKQSVESAEDQMRLVREASRPFNLRWSKTDKSHECVVSEDELEVCFHPNSSESSAAIRSCEPLRRNGNYYYWELKVLDKAYGTSVMFGVCTKRQLMHANDYCNLVGLDRFGWSLSHKGLIWHAGNNIQYTKPFPKDQSVTLGILLNTMRGEVSYFMDGKCLGVAFTGLNEFDEELYAVIGSTAKCTRIRLLGAFCGYNSLKERSCFTLLKEARNRNELIENLYQFQVPKTLISYIVDSSQVGQLTTGNIYSNHKQTECIFPKTETRYLTRNKLKTLR